MQQKNRKKTFFIKIEKWLKTGIARMKDSESSRWAASESGLKTPPSSISMQKTKHGKNTKKINKTYKNIKKKKHKKTLNQTKK